MNSSELTSAVEEMTGAPSYYGIAADKGGLVCPSTVTAMYLNRVPDENEDITSVSAASFDCMRKIFDGAANPFGGIGIKVSGRWFRYIAVTVLGHTSPPLSAAVA